VESAASATAAVEAAATSSAVGTATTTSAALRKGEAWRTSESDHNYYRE
jgi:hypothetical protein